VFSPYSIKILSISISFWSLSMASSRLFYSQKLGIHREVFPSLKSIAIICFFVAILQAPLIASFLFFFSYSVYFPVVFVLVVVVVQGIVTLVYRYSVKGIKSPSDSSRSNLYFVSCLTSWIAPFTVIVKEPANKSKYFMVVGFITALCYVLPFFYILFIDLKASIHCYYFFLIIPIWVLVSSIISLTVLDYLGNYHNLYKVSKCCCCSPIVHRSMIYDYLVYPNLFDLNTNEDFPTFFKSFLKDIKLNVPLPHTGDTVLHVAFQHKRFR
jgi:hypothetical protein